MEDEILIKDTDGVFKILKNNILTPVVTLEGDDNNLFSLSTDALLKKIIELKNTRLQNTFSYRLSLIKVICERGILENVLFNEKKNYGLVEIVEFVKSFLGTSQKSLEGIQELSEIGKRIFHYEITNYVDYNLDTKKFAFNDIDVIDKKQIQAIESLPSSDRIQKGLSASLILKSALGKTGNLEVFLEFINKGIFKTLFNFATINDLQNNIKLSDAKLLFGFSRTTDIRVDSNGYLRVSNDWQDINLARLKQSGLNHVAFANLIAVVYNILVGNKKIVMGGINIKDEKDRVVIV